MLRRSSHDCGQLVFVVRVKAEMGHEVILALEATEAARSSCDRTTTTGESLLSVKRNISAQLAFYGSMPTPAHCYTSLHSQIAGWFDDREFSKQIVVWHPKHPAYSLLVVRLLKDFHC